MPATDKFFRNLKSVHVVFAFSCLALFAVTIWMMQDDYDDEWRGIQKTAFEIEAERTRQGLQAAQKKASATVETLDKRLEAAIKTLKSQKAEAEEDRLLEEQRAAEFKVSLADTAAKSARETRNVAKAEYNIGIRDHFTGNRLAARMADFDAARIAVDDRELALERAQSELDDVKVQLADLTRQRDEIQAEQKKVEAESQRLEKVLARIAPTNFSWAKRKFMEWWIIDGFNSHLKITQDWLPDLEIELGMTTSARFDRCRTCHINIDRVEAGNVPTYPHGHTHSADYHDWIAANAYPHPYSTHPRPELYTSDASPHPVKDYGCTICHEGQGSATSFSNAAHYMNDPHQQHQWEKKYGFKTNHYWEYPMLPKRLRDASCLKCHHNVVELGVNPKFGASAPKAYKGYQLIKKFGCFGCHEIKGYEGNRSIGPDIRLEPSTDEDKSKYASDPNLVAGTMRKVGPALRHIKAKTTEAFVEYWTEDPTLFRPSTRMPRFFNLTNLQDAHAQKLQPIELAGITRYLFDKSEPLETLRTENGYQPDVARGKAAFAERGCLACHTHNQFPETTADFGPELSRTWAKIRPGPAGFNWLYTWLRDPERHHRRTKMPNLYLDPTDVGGKPVDDAADIASFLLTADPQDTTLDFNHEKHPQFDEVDLNEMVKLLLSGAKAMKRDDITALTKGGRYPLVRGAKLAGDETEFLYSGTVAETVLQTSFIANFGSKPFIHNGEHDLFWISGSNAGTASLISVYNQQTGELTLKKKLRRPLALDDRFVVNAPITRQMKLNYVGRRTISRYGCFGCHDIPGFEDARPIGTTLQDWGRKDTTKLALEHIEEYLHEHGETDGSSTHDKAVKALMDAKAGGFDNLDRFKDPRERKKEEKEAESALRTAFFYHDLLHHGRAGFIWQKLRQPRSYDYHAIETKRYDERLRMPKFKLSEEDVEAIATFVLGLVAQPPSDKYIYQPQGPAKDRIEGEKLLQKFNCAGCHIIDLPEIEYWEDIQNFNFVEGTLDDIRKDGYEISSPGMTREQMLAWFVKNKQTLLAGKQVQVPEKISQMLGLAERMYQGKVFDQPVDLPRLARLADKDPVRDKLGKWFDEHPSVMLFDSGSLGPREHPRGLSMLMKFNPPRNGATGRTMTVGAAGKQNTLSVVRFRGLLDSQPDLVMPVDSHEYGFNLWETLKLGGKVALPGEKITFHASRLVKHQPARGGAFSEWLVGLLMKTHSIDDAGLAWQKVPPPLYLEGKKVQTPWLYQFLRDPGKIRQVTVLRMPRFNMSDQEAQTLANYFAAKDGAAYPYQQIRQREPEYLAQKNKELRTVLAARKTDYLAESWNLLNGPSCFGCHSLGGRTFQKGNDPKQVQGPDLDIVGGRLRPDWTLLWLYKPAWITPYVAMPQPYALGNSFYPVLFGGNAESQTVSVRDAMMNHSRLMRQIGKTEYKLKQAAPAVSAGEE